MISHVTFEAIHQTHRYMLSFVSSCRAISLLTMPSFLARSLRDYSTFHVSNLTEARRHDEREMYVQTERKRGTTTDRFNVEKSCKVFERRLREHSFLSQESEHATLSIRNKPQEIDCKLRTCHGSVGSLSVSGADSSRSTT